MNRRNILLTATAIAAAAPFLTRLTGVTPAQAQTANAALISDNDRLLGDPEAPVTILEYSSLTCPHCASFHTQTLPQVKEEWIDTGKAKLVYRHFPLDRLALYAAMTASCLPTDRAYFAFLDVLFKTQDQWSRAQDPMGELGAMARTAGLGQEKFEACVADQDLADSILQQRLDGSQAFDIQATPTFVINGKKVSGALPYEDFAKTLSEVHEAS